MNEHYRHFPRRANTDHDPAARFAIYARYSSDNQHDASIEDQIRLCRTFAEGRGWVLSSSYDDRARSGASAMRVGYQQLLRDARAGDFDIVVAEALDRLSRDQADIATLFKLLDFAGVGLVTVQEGEITELHVGLKGTMNALYLKDLAQKTRRGLEGRVRQGRSGGGICYGYDLVAGETGARRIDEAEATVVRRIFAEYAAGRSPRALAKSLNAEGIPGPKGHPWRDTAIRGHITRGTGVLNNELYVGRLVWNRLTYVKDPDTGRRLSRPNPADQWVVEPVSELRILDDELWDAVKTRQHAIRESDGVKKARQSRFWERRRPTNLLTGLVHCGHCGSRFATVGKDYLACSAARGSGTCTNRRSVRRGTLEGLVLECLKDRLMAPELVKEFVDAVHEEVNRQRHDETSLRAGRTRELESVERQLRNLLDSVAEGLQGESVQERLQELEAMRSRLRRELSDYAPSPVRLHPNLAEVYRRKVEALQEALSDPDTRVQAADMLRGLIETINIRSTDNTIEVEIAGAIVHMVEAGLVNHNGKQANLDSETACSCPT